MTCSPRGHRALTLRDINEKATSQLPEGIPPALHQIMATRDGERGFFFPHAESLQKLEVIIITEQT